MFSTNVLNNVGKNFFDAAASFVDNPVEGRGVASLLSGV